MKFDPIFIIPFIPAIIMPAQASVEGWLGTYTNLRTLEITISRDAGVYNLNYQDNRNNVHWIGVVTAGNIIPDDRGTYKLTFLVTNQKDVTQVQSWNVMWNNNTEHILYIDMPLPLVPNQNTTYGFIRKGEALF